MPRTRASFKQEPNTDDTDDIMISDGPARSSGSTIRNDDVEMMNGNGQHAANANGYFTGEVVTDEPNDLMFGHRSKKLIEAIRGLSALGIDATLDSLPKFVVVGDQSHGKSSVVEALSQISLPRSEGTCTRCPFQITTTKSDTWSCTVSLLLQWEYNAAYQEPVYEHWKDKGSQNTVELVTVYDKADLENKLLRAQFAILNPQRDPQDILAIRDLDMSTSKLYFSPNVVSIVVSGNDLPELSIFDLPGAINMPQSESEEDVVPFIEEMLKQYLRDKKALVLLAVSLSSDIETSTAYKFVKQSNAIDRCMGVLTKPDLMVAQKEPRIRKMLGGEIFRIGDGWFVTRQLSQQELDNGDVSYDLARRWETDFFDTQQPWCTSLGPHGQKFGILNLQDAISTKLTDHILEYLPEISNRVKRRHRQVINKLQEFPDKELTPCGVVDTAIDGIVADIVEQLRKDADDKQFLDSYRSIIKDLKAELIAARPTLINITPGFKRRAIDISDDDDGTAAETPTSTPASKARKGNDSRAIPTSSGNAEEPRRSAKKKVKTEEDAVRSVYAPVRFRLDEIRKMVESGANSGVPGQLNPRVVDKIIVKSLARWPEMVDGTVAAIKKVVEKMLVTTINEKLATRKQTQLFNQTTRIIQALYSELVGKHKEVMDKIVLWETSRPITYATETISQGAAAALQELLVDRKNGRIDEYLDKMGKIPPFKPEDRKKAAEVVGADPYKREVEAMQRPLAFYDVAAERMVDYIAISTEHELLNALPEQLRIALRDGLKCKDSDYCAYLLADDPARERERLRLLAEGDKLKEALKMLDGLPFVL